MTQTQEKQPNDSARVGVITGAVEGIGAALAQSLAAKGWRLILLNRSEQKTRPLLENLHAQTPDLDCTVIETDLSDHPAIHASARRVLDEYGAIHGLFNNAGVLRNDLVHSPHGNELHFEVNTIAPYLLTTALLPGLKAAADQDGRAVVVTPSTSALKSVKRLDPAKLRSGSRPGLFGAYADSKMASAVITAHLAEEHRDDKVEFYAIDPGATRTSMTGRGSNAPLPVRLIWRWLPEPSAGAARLTAPLKPDWRGKSGDLIVGEKKRVIPDAVDNPEATQKLLAVVEAATRSSEENEH